MCGTMQFFEPDSVLCSDGEDDDVEDEACEPSQSRDSWSTVSFAASPAVDGAWLGLRLSTSLLSVVQHALVRLRIDVKECVNQLLPHAMAMMSFTNITF